MVFDAGRLADSLTAIDGAWRGARFCVAFSGGLDSSVLLHAMAELARTAGVALRAVHVNHGLQPDAARWAAACRSQCEASATPLRVIDLELAAPAGASLEAAAREARYAALAGTLEPGEWLLTAHHCDDQLETVLIQLLRGAGVEGLAAMPPRAPFGVGWHARPLLAFERSSLAHYAEVHRLAWVEDPMNESLRFDRGWLRARILPAVRERWPGAAGTVARSSTHLAAAARMLREMADADAERALDDGRLSLAALAALSRDRQLNLLRAWLRREGLRVPPAARLIEALREFHGARDDGAPLLRWDGGELRRYRGRLYAMAPLPARGNAGPSGAAGGSIDLGPGLGRFALVAGRRGGLPAGTAWTIGFRCGGESLRPHAGRPRKRLKDLCQEAGIVPWMRDRLPLVLAGDRLAAVGDLWMDTDVALPPGQAGLQPVWSERPRIY
jgi:tRNA(Ile)-lysidine synthase